MICNWIFLKSNYCDKQGVASEEKNGKGRKNRTLNYITAFKLLLSLGGVKRDGKYFEYNTVVDLLCVILRAWVPAERNIGRGQDFGKEMSLPAALTSF